MGLASPAHAACGGECESLVRGSGPILPEARSWEAPIGDRLRTQDRSGKLQNRRHINPAELAPEPPDEVQNSLQAAAISSVL